MHGCCCRIQTVPRPRNRAASTQHSFRLYTIERGEEEQEEEEAEEEEEEEEEVKTSKKKGRSRNHTQKRRKESKH